MRGNAPHLLRMLTKYDDGFSLTLLPPDEPIENPDNGAGVWADADLLYGITVLYTPDRTYWLVFRQRFNIWGSEVRLTHEDDLGMFDTPDEAVRLVTWLVDEYVRETERLEAERDDDHFDYTTIDYPEYDPDTAHFERWGRPAFPNEY